MGWVCSMHGQGKCTRKILVKKQHGKMLHMREACNWDDYFKFLGYVYMDCVILP